MRGHPSTSRCTRDRHAISPLSSGCEMASSSLRGRGCSRRCLDAPALELSVCSVCLRCPERPGSLPTDRAVENGALRRIALPTLREAPTMGAKSSAEKKSHPRPSNDMHPCAPTAVLGSTLAWSEPAGRAHYGCHTLPEARSEAWAWGLGARGSQAWFWPPRPI